MKNQKTKKRFSFIWNFFAPFFSFQASYNAFNCEIDKIKIIEMLHEIKSEIKLSQIFQSNGFDKSLLKTIIEYSFKVIGTKFKQDCLQYTPHMNYLKIPAMLKQALITLTNDVDVICSMALNPSMLASSRSSSMSSALATEATTTTATATISTSSSSEYNIFTEETFGTKLISSATGLHSVDVDAIKGKSSRPVHSDDDEADGDSDGDADADADADIVDVDFDNDSTVNANGNPAVNHFPVTQLLSKCNLSKSFNNTMQSVIALMECVDALENVCLIYIEAQFIEKFFKENLLKPSHNELFIKFSHLCLLYVNECLIRHQNANGSAQSTATSGNRNNNNRNDHCAVDTNVNAVDNDDNNDDDAAAGGRGGACGDDGGGSGADVGRNDGDAINVNDISEESTSAAGAAAPATAIKTDEKTTTTTTTAPSSTNRTNELIAVHNIENVLDEMVNGLKCIDAVLKQQSISAEINQLEKYNRNIELQLNVVFEATNTFLANKIFRNKLNSKSSSENCYCPRVIAKPVAEPLAKLSTHQMASAPSPSRRAAATGEQSTTAPLTNETDAKKSCLNVCKKAIFLGQFVEMCLSNKTTRNCFGVDDYLVTDSIAAKYFTRNTNHMAGLKVSDRTQAVWLVTI